MDKTTKVGLTAAAFMACAPGAALAAPTLGLCFGGTQICQTSTTSFPPASNPATLSFLGFSNAVAALVGANPTLAGATLTDVHESLTGSGAVSGTVSNPNSVSISITNSFSDGLSKSLPAPIGLLSVVTVNASTTATLPAGGQISDSRSGSASMSASASITNPNTSPYLNNFSVTASDIGFFLGAAGFTGVVVQTGSVTSALTDRIAFSFSTSPPPTTTTTTTPEPATLSLLGSGLIGIGLARLARRRRKS